MVYDPQLLQRTSVFTLKMTTYELNLGELHALKGKTILITGAASGIGRATAIIAHREITESPE